MSSLDGARVIITAPLFFEAEHRDDVVAQLTSGLETQLGPTWPEGVDLSFGQWQKLALARGFMRDGPLVLVLDEPTAGVDPIGSKDIRDLILRLKGMGKTVLLSSHLLAQVQDVCDRIVILYRGKKQTLGHVQDLLQVRDAPAGADE
mgnify:CR=1 FL=1